MEVTTPEHRWKSGKRYGKTRNAERKGLLPNTVIAFLQPLSCFVPMTKTLKSWFFARSIKL